MSAVVELSEQLDNSSRNAGLSRSRTVLAFLSSEYFTLRDETTLLLNSRLVPATPAPVNDAPQHPSAPQHGARPRRARGTSRIYSGWHPVVDTWCSGPGRTTQL